MDTVQRSDLDYCERKNGLPAHIRLARKLREKIKSGELKPGHRFPPTKEFAAQLGTYPLAVHEAFSILSTEGLVERLRRSGTFVRGSSATLGSVAIYLGVETMAPKFLLFLRLVIAELTGQLQEEGVNYAPLLDPRSDEEQDRPWDILVKALEKKKYQAVIAIGADDVRMQWLNKLGVPVASLADARLRMDEFAEKSARALRENQCRSAGLIFNLSRGSKEVVQVKNALRRNGLEFHDEWHIFPEEEYVHGIDMERFGHDGFMKIWSQQERPDGLIVFPDTALPGISAALVRQKVSVPDDLKLAVHMNKGNDTFFPFDATMIVIDPAEFANAVLKQLRRKFAGEVPAPEEIGFSLRKIQPTIENSK